MPEGIYKNLLLDKLAKKLSLAREKLNTPTNMRPPEKKITRIKLTGINPAIVAIQLLLQTPSLAQLAANISFDVDSPEKKLLASLITHCQNTSSLSFGDVLSETEDESTRTLLATIANMPLHIPEAGYKAEFTGALTRLAEHAEAKMRADLIEKTKHSTLTSDEMDLLRSLIAKKQSER